MKRVIKIAAIAAIAALAICGCKKNSTLSGLDPANFVGEYNGKATALYTLTNANGMEVCITNFGGRIVSILVPNKEGTLTDVVLGFDNIHDYLPENYDSNFGAVVGRYANRIKDGKITVDGTEYQLPQNNFGHCLHGGPTGWYNQIFDVLEADETHIKLEIVSPDGDNGFPGNVTAHVTYTLTEDNAIDIKYDATTDKDTYVNMTNHTYFNLSGDPANHPITEDNLWINAEGFTPVDDTFMTTGEILGFEEHPAFDFRETKSIGQDIECDDEQLKFGNGYDHNYVLATNGDITIPAVELTCPHNGLQLIVYTDEPGMQVYSGNFLDGTAKGKGGVEYQFRTAICLESQKYPDTPNKPEWPSALLKAGETYNSHCIFAFAIYEPEEIAEEEIAAEE